MDDMTTSPHLDRVPEWTQGDRLRKARTLTGLTVREFADSIGVSHGTVTSAETDARTVRRITLNAWALATGVSLEWLETGVAGTQPTPPGPGKATDALDKLTRQKQGRSQRVPTTRQYLQPALVAA